MGVVAILEALVCTCECVSRSLCVSVCAYMHANVCECGHQWVAVCLVLLPGDTKRTQCWFLYAVPDLTHKAMQSDTSPHLPPTTRA